MDTEFINIIDGDSGLIWLCVAFTDSDGGDHLCYLHPSGHVESAMSTGHHIPLYNHDPSLITATPDWEIE